VRCDNACIKLRPDFSLKDEAMTKPNELALAVFVLLFRAFRASCRSTPLPVATAIRKQMSQEAP
jgi:hypothetical protein